MERNLWKDKQFSCLGSKMIYAMSDLHGCYEKYIHMLEKIKLNNNDTLYILGDVIDRGDAGLDILFDIMTRSNVIPLLGNHEYMAYTVLKKLNVEIIEYNYKKHLSAKDIEAYENWMFNGGITTFKQFRKLNKEKRKAIIDYIGDFELYDELEVGGREYLLVHGGVGEFKEEKDIEECNLHEVIWSRCDYSKQYYKNKYLVTGHTPTYCIGKEYEGKIYMKNNHIAIDCGAAHGKPLGCICLDTLEEFYVD